MSEEADSERYVDPNNAAIFRAAWWKFLQLPLNSQSAEKKCCWGFRSISTRSTEKTSTVCPDNSLSPYPEEGWQECHTEKKKEMSHRAPVSQSHRICLKNLLASSLDSVCYDLCKLSSFSAPGWPSSIFAPEEMLKSWFFSCWMCNTEEFLLLTRFHKSETRLY